MINAGDTAWMLVATALVFFMLAGLALVYGGLVGEKNPVGTMAQSYVATAWGAIGVVLTAVFAGRVVNAAEVGGGGRVGAAGPPGAPGLDRHRVPVPHDLAGALGHRPDGRAAGGARRAGRRPRPGRLRRVRVPAATVELPEPVAGHDGGRLGRAPGVTT